MGRLTLMQDTISLQAPLLGWTQDTFVVIGMFRVRQSEQDVGMRHIWADLSFVDGQTSCMPQEMTVCHSIIAQLLPTIGVQLQSLKCYFKYCHYSLL